MLRDPSISQRPEASGGAAKLGRELGVRPLRDGVAGGGTGCFRTSAREQDRGGAGAERRERRGLRDVDRLGPRELRPHQVSPGELERSPGLGVAGEQLEAKLAVDEAGALGPDLELRRRLEPVASRLLGLRTYARLLGQFGARAISALMDTGLVVAIVLAVAFALTNGFHDAANSIAALVATGVATPFQAVVLACVFNLLGPLLLGAAVANTIGGIVTVAPSAANQVIGGGLAAAVAWNLATWVRGLPSSSAQSLVGGLVGAALAEGGVEAVNWGGFAHGRPVGVLGTLVSLAISPPLGALSALLVIRALRRMGRRATRRWAMPVRGGQWATAAALAFSHGANDAQKAVGLIAALLLANGRINSRAALDVGDRGMRGGADRRHGLQLREAARAAAERQARQSADVVTAKKRLQQPCRRHRSRRQTGKARRADADTESAVSARDSERFHDAYDRLLKHVRTEGTRLRPDDLRPSDLLLPPADSSVIEVARELQALDLIPG